MPTLIWPLTLIFALFINPRNSRSHVWGEFKQTFSLDVKKGSKEKYIEKAALKTIGAFLNTEGGDLLVGVDDDGNIAYSGEREHQFRFMVNT